jgi:hypothetical protein
MAISNIGLLQLAISTYSPPLPLGHNFNACSVSLLQGMLSPTGSGHFGPSSASSGGTDTQTQDKYTHMSYLLRLVQVVTIGPT